MERILTTCRINYDNLYQLIVFWYLGDKNNRKQQVIKLLEGLKFHFLTKNFFIDVVNNDARLNNIKKLKAYERIKDKMEMILQFHMASKPRKLERFPILLTELESNPSINTFNFKYKIIASLDMRKTFNFFFRGVAFILTFLVADNQFHCILKIQKELSGLKSEFYIQQTYKLSVFSHTRNSMIDIYNNTVIAKDDIVFVIKDPLKIPWSSVLSGENGHFKDNIIMFAMSIIDEDPQS